MTLDSMQFKNLLGALEQTFPTDDALKELTLLACNKHLDAITTAGNTHIKTMEMIKAAEAENWLDKLINTALDLRKTEPKLQQIHQEFQPNFFEKTSNPYQTLSLRGDRGLVNRQGLREAMKNFNKEDGKRILVVSGPPVSGKTYTRQFISYLQIKLKNFETVSIDLAEDFTGEEIRPELLGEAIAKQIKTLEEMPKRQNEQDARWNSCFCKWLIGQLRTSNMTYWLVLDNFDKIFLPQGTLDLIRKLAIHIEENLTQLRLILLRYRKQDELPEQDALLVEVEGGVEFEKLTRFSQEEVENELNEFFIQLYAERSQGKSLSDDVAASVANVLRQIDFKREEFLRMLGKALGNEMKAVNLGG